MPGTLLNKILCVQHLQDYFKNHLQIWIHLPPRFQDSSLSLSRSNSDTASTSPVILAFPSLIDLPLQVQHQAARQRANPSLTQRTLAPEASRLKHPLVNKCTASTPPFQKEREGEKLEQNNREFVLFLKSHCGVVLPSQALESWVVNCSTGASPTSSRTPVPQQSDCCKACRHVWGMWIHGCHWLPY